LYIALAASWDQGDVNHVTGDVSFLCYFLVKRRTVLTILDCGSLESSHGLKRWVLWFFWYWLPEKRCAAIIVISDATKEQLLRFLDCDHKKIHVIHCNVSPEFQISPKNFNSVRPRLLQVGTGYNKNIERIAAALCGLNCELMIIGELSDSQSAVLDQNNISFLNRVGLSREELLDEYRHCDLLVFVSTYEGFGLPIVEANAVGRPVVTSNILSMPEVAGEAACLVDPLDVESIRAGICRIIEDDEFREEMVERGFLNAKRFLAERIAGRYSDLYREIHRDVLN